MSALVVLPAPPPSGVEERFHRLAAEWKEQSAYLSNSARMAMLPPYQRIIGMGMAVVPLILSDLRCEPEFWFWALEAITGQDPVPADARGDIQAMTNAWVEWGKRFVTGPTEITIQNPFNPGSFQTGFVDLRADFTIGSNVA